MDSFCGGGSRGSGLIRESDGELYANGGVYRGCIREITESRLIRKKNTHFLAFLERNGGCADFYFLACATTDEDFYAIHVSTRGGIQLFEEEDGIIGFQNGGNILGYELVEGIYVVPCKRVVCCLEVGVQEFSGEECIRIGRVEF